MSQMRTVRLVLLYILALIPAAVLAIAAFFKAGDPQMFAEQITLHHVTPASWSPWLAYLFVGAELVLAAALLTLVVPRLVFAVNIVLMLGFIGVTAWAWAHGTIEGCGCFGRLVDRTPLETIVEDAIIVVASIFGIMLAKGFRTRRWQWAAFCVLLIPALVLTAFGSSLPIDGLVVGIRPGTNLSNMAIEGAPFDLAEGGVLLVVFDPQAGLEDDALERLRTVASREEGPRVLAVAVGSCADALKWRLRNRPNFAVAWASDRVMRQYYRRLPVVFLLDDGIVQRVWWSGVPPKDDLATSLSGPRANTAAPARAGTL